MVGRARAIACTFVVSTAMLVACCTNSLAGVTIAASYVDMQTADDVSFTQNVHNLSPGDPINLAQGQYFRFGIALVATGNSNPAAGAAWDLANQAHGHPAQPVNLGLAIAGMNVNSSDPNGAILKVVPGQIRGSNPKADTLAIVNPALNCPFIASGFADGGQVTGYITAASVIADPMTVGGIIQLADFTTQTTFFNNLVFQQVSSPGVPVTLTPLLFTEANTAPLWVNLSPGTVDGQGNPLAPATYGVRALQLSSNLLAEPADLTPSDISLDTLINVPPLQFNSVPEPTVCALFVVGLLLVLPQRPVVARNLSLAR